MFKRISIICAVFLVVNLSFAKDKNKSVLPAYVLGAHTVTVLIDPSAGVSIDDPRANQNAQKDVETALLDWGRLEPVMGTQTADLIIVVRKGNGRLFNETIADARQNNRAGAINPNDNGAQIGSQRGPQAPLSSNAGIDSNPGGPRPQSEIGETDDTFLVYRGGVQNPLDAPPLWRYVARDGLSPRSVPAVAAFKKAVADAEKAAAKKP